MNRLAKTLSPTKRSSAALVLMGGVFVTALILSSPFVFAAGGGGDGDGGGGGGGDVGGGGCITVDEWTPTCAYGCSNGVWGNFIGDDGSCAGDGGGGGGGGGTPSCTDGIQNQDETGVDTGGVCGGGGGGGATCVLNDCGTGDVCKNIPGAQADVPTGYSNDTTVADNCLPTSCPRSNGVYIVGVACDYCRNTSGTQNSGASAYTAPSGYTIDSSGYCDAIVLAETCSLTPGATTIASGDSTTLTWSCSQSASSAGLNFSTGGAPSGSVSVSPSATTAYALSCSAGCSANATVTVANPNLSIGANPTRVHSGDSSTISWTATEVESCTVSGPGFSGSGLTGSGSSGPITAQSTYTLTCQTVGSAMSASVTVNLIPSGVEI